MIHFCKVPRMNALVKNALGVMTVIMAVSLMIGIVTAESGPEKAGKTVVAKVNGTDIYLDELVPMVEMAKARYRKSGYRAFTPDFETKILRQELDGLIDKELLVQAAAGVHEKEFVEKVELRMKAMVQARFQNATTAEKVNPASLSSQHLESLRNDALVEEYLDKRGVAGLQVPENDVQEFYEKNKKSFTEPEKVKASHILIGPSRNANGDEVEKARTKALQISNELKNGGDFAELAKKNSICATAANGGDLGYIQPGFMPKDFNTVAFALKPGETSEPVRTQHGFHIIRVYEKQPARVPELAEVKDTISKYLINAYKRKKIDEILAELKKKAQIESHIN